MQWGLQCGDRVEVLACAGTSAPGYDSGAFGTVLRGAVRNGRPRYLVRMDQMDHLYGLYWLGAERLRRVSERVA